MYWYERHFYHDPTILDSLKCQSVGQHRLIEKLFLMKYKEREYFQHQREAVKLKLKIKCNEYFSYHFPRPGGVKSYKAVLKFRYQAPLFTFYFWTLKKSFPCIPKMPQGNTGIVRWFRAGPLSILIFKSWQVCDWRGQSIIMLRFTDLIWPRVFRRYNVGLVYICLTFFKLSIVVDILCFAYSLSILLYTLSLLYPRPTKLEGGGYTGFTLSVRPSVRLSVDDMVSGA